MGMTHITAMFICKIYVLSNQNRSNSFDWPTSASHSCFVFISLTKKCNHCYIKT